MSRPEMPMEFWNSLKPEARSVWAFDWERSVFAWVDAHRHPWLDAFLLPASWITEWGLLWIAVLVVMFVWGDARRKRRAVLMGVALFVLSVGVIVPLMYLLPRQRPYQALPGVAALSLPLTTPSFPSGHAKSAALVAVALGAGHRRRAPWLALFAVVIAYARMYCGMHWPLDLLAGAALGAAGGVLLLRLEARMALPPAARRGPPHLPQH